MIYVLDTDMFSLIYYSKNGVRERIARESFEHRIAISTITRIEVLRGRIESVLKAENGEKVIRAIELLGHSERYLAEFATLPFNAAAGDRFDRLLKTKLKCRPGRNDLLIACVALAQSATLVIRNTKDFAGIPNLKLENWAD